MKPKPPKKDTFFSKSPKKNEDENTKQEDIKDNIQAGLAALRADVEKKKKSQSVIQDDGTEDVKNLPWTKSVPTENPHTKTDITETIPPTSEQQSIEAGYEEYCRQYHEYWQYYHWYHANPGISSQYPPPQEPPRHPAMLHSRPVYPSMLHSRPVYPNMPPLTTGGPNGTQQQPGPTVYAHSAGNVPPALPDLSKPPPSWPIPPPPPPPQSTESTSSTSLPAVSDVPKESSSSIQQTSSTHKPEASKASSSSAPQPVHYSSGPQKVQPKPKLKYVPLHTIPASLPEPPGIGVTPVYYRSMDEKNQY